MILSAWNQHKKISQKTFFDSSFACIWTKKHVASLILHSERQQSKIFDANTINVNKIKIKTSLAGGFSRGESSHQLMMRASGSKPRTC